MLKRCNVNFVVRDGPKTKETSMNVVQVIRNISVKGKCTRTGQVAFVGMMMLARVLSQRFRRVELILLGSFSYVANE